MDEKELKPEALESVSGGGWDPQPDEPDPTTKDTESAVPGGGRILPGGGEWPGKKGPRGG